MTVVTQSYNNTETKRRHYNYKSFTVWPTTMRMSWQYRWTYCDVTSLRLYWGRNIVTQERNSVSKNGEFWEGSVAEAETI